MNIYEKLLNIQMELKAPKGQTNSFGHYKYRSCEDILEAVKPLCKKYNLTLMLSDTLENIGERYYIKACVAVYDIEAKDTDKYIMNYAYAREELDKKGMDGSQITGTASSYARKYALNGMFCIDDTKDADTDAYKQQQEEFKPTKKELEEMEKVIDNIKLNALNESLIKNNISDKIITDVLIQYGYLETRDIQLKDYMNIVNDFKKHIKGA